MHSEKDEILLHDYFDNLLSKEQEEQFEEYIVDHIELAIDLGRLKNLRRNLKNMSSNFTPPDSVIENIVSSLLKNKENVDTFASEQDSMFNESTKKDDVKKIKKPRKKLRPKTKYRIKVFSKYLALFLFLCAIGYGYFHYKEINKTTPWFVKVFNDVDSSQAQELYAGINTVIKTENSQLAFVSIAQKATLELSDNAKIKVIKGTQSLNSIKYISGDVLFQPVYGNEIFEIKFGHINLYSSNAEFFINYNSPLIFINVISNYVKIKSNVFEYKIPLNYQFELINESNISVPVNKNSSKYYHQLIESYIDAPSSYILEKIIETSGLNEAITLHFLISQADPEYRELIIDKLNTISPMPISCNKEKTLILDKQALDDWWETIYISID